MATRWTIFEAFAAPKPLGSGLLLQPAGLAALRALGLEGAARAAGARVDRLDGRDQTGRRILQLDYGVWRKGTHGVGIRRSALFDLLYDAVKAQGVAVVTNAAITLIEDFDRPRLRAEDGRTFDALTSSLSPTARPQGCAARSGRRRKPRSIRGAPYSPIAPMRPGPSPAR